MSTSPHPRSDADWRERLDAHTYHITRQAGTEAPFTGTLLHNKATGVYHCVCCQAPLFSSQHKYDSGSGWPSFTQPLTAKATSHHPDTSHGMTRIEVRCPHCNAHLGHVFPDGPAPTGQRYCINSAALTFQPEEPQAAGESHA